MSDGGFFLMHRGWRENPVFKGEFSRADAWVWLIENACWKPTRHDVKGRNVVLERGQLCVSRERLAAVWGWSPSAVERFLARLKTEQMIERETGQGKSIITICNYAKYQDQSIKTGQENEHKAGHKSDRDRTAKEQGNKEKREPNGSHTPLTPHRERDWPVLPDWLPAEPWNGFIEMRRRNGNMPTARAVGLMIGKLERWKAQGHDPGEILDNSTESNWRGLFEPKESPNGRYPPGTGIQQTSRGPNPDPLIDMLAAARAARAAEDSGDHPGTGDGTRSALPAIISG